MKLEFLKVRFRNFLSFGNTWQEVDLQNGLNLVVSDAERSNGFGKSSALFSISFAQFGKIQKNVVKNDIVNWQNDKNCEVHLTIKKADDIIEIHRGLKPNYLRIYINDVLQPQESDLRLTQKKLEEEILGWNIDMYESLISCNPNNTISILDTTAAKKRQFLENLFSDIEYFSILMEKTKDKLRSIKQKIDDNNIKIEYVQNHKLEIENENNQLEKELKETGIEKLFKLYNDAKDEYNKIIENAESIDENDIKVKEKELSKIESQISENDKMVSDIKEKLYRYKIDVSSLQKDLITAEKNLDLQKEIDEIDKILNQSKDMSQDIETIKSEIDAVNDNISKEKSKKSEIDAEILSLNKQLKNLTPDKNLKEKSICPKCGRNIKYDEIEKHFKNERDNTKKKIESFKKSLVEVEKNIKSYESHHKKLSKKHKDLISKENKAKELIEKKKYLENFIDTTLVYDDINDRINNLNDDIKSLEKDRIDIDGKTSILLLQKDDLKSKIDIYNQSKNKIVEYKQRVVDCENNYKWTKEKVKSLKSRIKTKQQKIQSLSEDLEKIQTLNKKLFDLQDYFTYLKETLKDGNIKSYVINSMMPHINKKVNDYLGIAEIDFFVEVDSWLNVSISGPHCRNDCKFGSLSGGESKVLDMIVKFALMEIAQLKAKTFPDILILDEFLDTSIDSYHIEKMIQIIKHKQEKDNLKVYIITHKGTIMEFVDGNLLKIAKKDGFSYISK